MSFRVSQGLNKDAIGKALSTSHALSEWWSLLLLSRGPPPRCPGLRRFPGDCVLSYRNPCADVSSAFDIFNSRYMMKTTVVIVLLGLYKSVPLPPPPLFSGWSASWNLLQISGFIHSNMCFRQLVHFCVTPCVPIQRRLAITIATTACGAYALSQKQSICLKKKNYTHTLICNMKFYFMVSVKENHASE